MIKSHIDLIQTLNASLIDYDFRSLTPESFLNVSINDMVSNINLHLAEITSEHPNFLTDMWKHIDASMNLKSCDGFALVDACNPFSSESGFVWSFLYLLLNKDLKRTCLITCSCTNPYCSLHDDYDEDDDCYDDDNQQQLDETMDSEDNCSDYEMDVAHDEI